MMTKNKKHGFLKKIGFISPWFISPVLTYTHYWFMTDSLIRNTNENLGNLLKKGRNWSFFSNGLTSQLTLAFYVTVGCLYIFFL